MDNPSETGRSPSSPWLSSAPPPHGGFVAPPTSSSLFAQQPGGASLPSTSLSGIPMGLYTLPGKEELYLYGYGRQFGDKLTYTAGVSYAAGLALGGGFGLIRGLTRPLPGTLGASSLSAEAVPPRNAPNLRLRLNAVLNACGKHAPELASEFGALGLFYCCFNSLGVNFFGDSPTNAPAAGLLAGALYKCRASHKVLASYAIASSGVFFAIDQYIRRFM